MSVAPGIDVLLAGGAAGLHGKRVGAIVNPTSVDRRLGHLADRLRSLPGVRLSALFGPEHGIGGRAQYMEPVGDTRDTAGVPIYSLYGSTFESLSPRREWLTGLDALVFDIQDVGSRYYTYVYTMALAMKVAGEMGVEFWVLDRPNPLGGVQVEGNVVQDGFRSFVGLYPLPNRHGMTAGELAQWFNVEQGFHCDLHVVACTGWKRTMRWEETGLPFVPPSPNMPTADTARVYPGMCLLEGTNVSEGRGTCRPFELFGAPWLDAGAVADRLNQEGLPGVRFRAASFTPTFDKFKGETCQGAMIHVTEVDAFRPVLTGVAVTKACRELGDRRFAWRDKAYEFVEDVPAFDLLCGTDRVRRGMEAGESLSALTQGFEGEAQAFQARAARHRLYD